MNLKIPVFLLLSLLIGTQKIDAQPNDTLVPLKVLLRRSIVPAVLITGGLVLNNSHAEKSLQTNLRNSVGNNFHVPVDDYFQFAPVAEMYLADLDGIKSKNHWFDQSKYLFISNVISLSITTGLKYALHKTRPSGDSYSFPSGHTTFAFTNAAVLYNEFSDTSPWVAYSGFLFAATTGTFRMLNNRHWLSDVLVGAGIGMAATQLVYYLEPLKNFNPFKKVKHVVFIPQFNASQYGFYFSYAF